MGAWPEGLQGHTCVEPRLQGCGKCFGPGGGGASVRCPAPCNKGGVKATCSLPSGEGALASFRLEGRSPEEDRPQESSSLLVHLWGGHRPPSLCSEHSVSSGLCTFTSTFLLMQRYPESLGISSAAWTSLMAPTVKASVYNAGDPGSSPGLGRKIPWRRKWQSTPVLLPGESHGQRSLVGNSLWGLKESDTTERLQSVSPSGSLPGSKA